MSVENLITEHIDIWTSAIQAKSASGRGSGKKLELYGIKKLRELILELAVRGKLVPQDPTDEPASVLLARIAAEKAQLVKEGKIKKAKSIPLEKMEEEPFEIPSGWEWAWFGNICHIERGGSPRPIKSFLTDSPSGLNWIKIGDTEIGGKYITQTAEKIRPEGLTKTRKVYPGDFLLTNSMSFGRPYITKIEGCIHDGWLRISPPKSLDKDYLFNLLSSPVLKRCFAESAAGAVVMNLNADKVAETRIAIPPENEQHRIVAKVDELMALCDQLEQQTDASIEAHQQLVTVLLDSLLLPPATADGSLLLPSASAEGSLSSYAADEFMANWARISDHFDTLFTTEASIDALKQTILQLAVMGKLVSQDPNDEPASALLERIAAEKVLLVKEKKIKKEKPLPAISEDEKPFELPLGWGWSRISESSLFCEYGSSEKTVSELSDGVPVLKMGDIQDGKVILGSHQVVSPKIDDLPNLYLKKGDILYNRTNSAELVGKTGMFDGDDDTYTFASYLIRIRCSIHNIRPEYLTLCMNSPLFRKTQIEPHIKQQCGQANVNGTLMKSMLVSIPPYHEQVLILQKIHELMTLCDQLKSCLQISQQTQLALAESLVEGALA